MPAVPSVDEIQQQILSSTPNGDGPLGGILRATGLAPNEKQAREMAQVIHDTTQAYQADIFSRIFDFLTGKDVAAGAGQAVEDALLAKGFKGEWASRAEGVVVEKAQEALSGGLGSLIPDDTPKQASSELAIS